MQPNLIAKKIRNNLIEQKSKLQKYLEVLDKEEEQLLLEDPDKLIEYISLEKNIVNELTAFSKILEPLEIMYYSSPYKKDKELVDIKGNIEYLTKQVKEKSVDNKDRLETILVKVKNQIKGLNKVGFTKSAYNIVDSRLVDVNG